ncbi:hypothetical protein GGF46_002084 [Coemansia sp. RSA 552]|nr:hypothetical protein GGF46_002084 [Coemansia sp. RSA 552]
MKMPSAPEEGVLAVREPKALVSGESVLGSPRLAVRGLAVPELAVPEPVVPELGLKRLALVQGAGQGWPAQESGLLPRYMRDRRRRR